MAQKQIQSTSQWGGAILLIATLACCTLPESGFHGPPMVRNQHPVELTVLELTPRQGHILPAGQMLIATQSSLTNQVLHSRTSDDEPFQFDGETLRLAAIGRVGLGRGFDLEISPGVTLAGSGFLDRSIDQFHDFFGLPCGLRNQVGTNEYAMEIWKNGGTIYSLPADRLLFNDLPVTLSWQALKGNKRGWPPALLARIATEIPLGGKGCGNGGWDFGAGITASSLLGNMELSGTFSMTIPHTPSLVKKLGAEYKPRVSGSLSAEMPITGDISLLMHLEANQSVLAGLDAGRLNRTHLLLWTGARFNLGKGFFCDLLLGEGLTQKLSPDFTLSLSINRRF